MHFPYDAEDVMKLARWAVAVEHNQLARWTARKLRVSFGDIAQEVIVRFLQTVARRNMQEFTLSTLITNQARWTMLRMFSSQKLTTENVAAPEPQYQVDWDAADDKTEAAMAWNEFRKQLNHRDRTLLELRFGFNGQSYTLEECGRLFRLSQERVRQIERKALLRLQGTPTFRRLASEYQREVQDAPLDLESIHAAD